MINLKRQAKRNKLIRKLFFYYAPKDIDIKLIVKRIGRAQGSYCQTRGISSGNPRHIILLSLAGINYTVKYGYSNGYYPFRHEKTKPIVMGSKKNALRFVILHEIYHALSYHTPFKNTEKFADDYAITKIKNQNKYKKIK